jgi:hypothetical protein
MRYRGRGGIATRQNSGEASINQDQWNDALIRDR